MTGLAHRQNAGFAPDIFAWLEGPFVSPRPVGAQPMRMEEHVANGRYVLRAELPGVDPAKDMEVSVAKGILTIGAREGSFAGGPRSFRIKWISGPRKGANDPDTEPDATVKYTGAPVSVRH